MINRLFVKFCPYKIFKGEDGEDQIDTGPFLPGNEVTKIEGYIMSMSVRSEQQSGVLHNYVLISGDLKDDKEALVIIRESFNGLLDSVEATLNG